MTFYNNADGEDLLLVAYDDGTLLRYLAKDSTGCSLYAFFLLLSKISKQ